MTILHRSEIDRIAKNNRKYGICFQQRKVVCRYNPPRIGLDIATACQMKCWFCPYHGREISPLFKPATSFMSLEMVNTILDIFEHTTKIGIGLSGEPLLHKKLIDIIELIQTKKPETKASISTNGLLIDKYDLDEAFSHSVIKAINISVDTLDEDVHAEWSGMSGSLERVLDNLRTITEWKDKHRKGDLQIIASFVIPKSDYGQIKDMISFMQQFKVDFLGFQNYIPPDCIGENTLTTEDREVLSYFHELSSRVKSDFMVGLVNPIDMAASKNYCNQPWSQLTIDPDGNISPCCNIPRNELFGNISDDGIWNGKTFKDTRSAFHDGKTPFKYCDFCWANQDMEKRILIERTKKN